MCAMVRRLRHASDFSFCKEGGVMDTPNSWRVVCQDPGDGSGDVIVELAEKKKRRKNVGEKDKLWVYVSAI